MLTISEYKEKIEAFSKIDLNSSWVSFSLEQLNVGGKARLALCPIQQNKPYQIIRLIQWVFNQIFSYCLGNPYLNRAQNLCRFNEDVVNFLSDNESGDLIRNTESVVKDIMKKFEKNIPKEFFQEITDSISSAADRYRQRILARKVQELADSEKFQELCTSKELQRPGSFEIAYAMDWEKDDPVLFDETYFNQLCATLGLVIAGVANAALHADFANLRTLKSLNPEHLNGFINFLYHLHQNFFIHDAYGNLLSDENVAVLKKMVLSILNILNKRRQEKDFSRLYASTISQMMEALQTCSHKINLGIENVFMDLSFPKESGSIGHKIKLSLQRMRSDLFWASIYHCASLEENAQQPKCQREDTTTTAVYYLSRPISKELGLPPSICAFDTNKQAEDHYALKGQENNIRAYFKEHYTPATILKRIWEEVINPYNQDDLPKLFANWVQTSYTDLENCLDENGLYTFDVVLALLQDLQIIKDSSL